MNTTTEDGDHTWMHNHSRNYDYDEWNPFELYGMSTTWVFYVVNVVAPIAVFGGVFANILALVVLVRNRLWLKHEGYVYLAATFSANVGVLLFCTNASWLTANYRSWRHLPANFSNFTCKFLHFLMSIFFASGWLSVALLFSVYLREHLVHRRRCGCPIFASKYCTLFASKIIVGVIFGVLFVLGIPYLVTFQLTTDFECFASPHWVFGVALLVESILMWVLPFALFLPIILLITLCTKREGDAFGFSHIGERSAYDDQMRVVAVTLSSMTLFSQFTLVFLHTSSHGIVGRTFSLFVELAHGLSLGVQALLCFVLLTTFREGLRSLLRSIRCCRRLFPSMEEEGEEEAVRLSAIQDDPPTTPET